MTQPASRLVVRGLGKRYGDQVALEDLDLDLPGSTLLAVVGANGAGKSTFLGSLAGILRHDGTASLDGRQIRPGDRRITYLPQGLRLPAAATVADVLGLLRALAGGRPDRVPPPEGFVPEGSRRIGELSGGQAQRVALVGTLMGAPDLVLLDEPLANLDDEARAIATGLFRAHRDAGAMVLVASPAARDVLATADLAGRIDDGRLAALGPASALLASLGHSLASEGAA